MSVTLSITIYLATFAFSILLYKFSLVCKNKAGARICLAIAVCIPCVTAAFRTSGTDLKSYFQYYDTIKSVNFKSGCEPLWVVVNLLSPNKRCMLFITAMLFLSFCMGSVNCFVKKSKSMAWSIVLLVFYSTFLNIMRQMIAVAIVAYFFKYLFEKKYLIYILGVVMASLFHKSAITMIMIPAIIFLANKFNKYDVLILITAISMPFAAPLIFKALEKFNIYAGYVHNIDFKFEPQFILCMLPPTFLYYVTGGRKKHSDILNNLFYIYLVSFPMQTFGFMAQYVDRLTYNFYFTVCLFVPMIIDEIEDITKQRRLAFAMNSWFLIYYVGVFVVVGTAAVYPYIDYSSSGIFI